MTGWHLALLVLGWAVGAGSPGPATMAISGTAMGEGRRSAFLLALGITCGSASWGIAAALGLSALMLANGWVFEALRYIAAAYLMYLAAKSLRSAMRPRPPAKARNAGRRAFLKGLLIHLTNPKPILGWGAIYAIALPHNAAPADVWMLFACLIAASASVFLGYSLLFSHPAIARGYARLRRGFEAVFGLLFGAASLGILGAKLRT